MIFFAGRPKQPLVQAKKRSTEGQCSVPMFNTPYPVTGKISKHFTAVAKKILMSQNVSLRESPVCLSRHWPA